MRFGRALRADRTPTHPPARAYLVPLRKEESVKVIFHPDMIWAATLIPTNPDVEAILRRDAARVDQLYNCEGMGG